MALLKKKALTTVTKTVTSLAPKVSKLEGATEKIDELFQKHYVKKSKKVESKKEVEAKVSTIQKEAKVAKEEVKAKKGMTIDDIWVKVLSEAVGKSMTDQQIADAVSKEVMNILGKDKRYLEETVSGHRSGYNCGKYAIQKGVKPAVRLVKYISK